MKKTLVLGIGNLLLADEGVGVHAARALMEQRTGGATVVDVGTAILDALPLLNEAERIILVDAVQCGADPGTVYRMPLEDFSRKECIASMHGFDLPWALALAGRSSPPEVVVIGVEPAVIGWSLDLSPEVAASLPTVVEAVKAEIAGPASGRPLSAGRGKLPAPAARRLGGARGLAPSAKVTTARRQN